MTEKETSMASLRQHLLYLLKGGGAHISLKNAIKGLPDSCHGKKASASLHTPWQLLEHIRIAQWDILEFSRNAAHVSPKFPGGYWPDSEAPPDSGAWKNSIKAFHADLSAMEELVTDPTVDLFARIPHGDGQTILREALLVADHNAYHTGQMMLVCTLLNEGE